MNRTTQSFLRRVRGALAALAILAVCACSGAPSAAPPPDLMSLEEAFTATVRAVEEKVHTGSEIAVYEITSQSREIGAFFLDELDSAFSAGGKFVLLARKDALAAVDAEHRFRCPAL